MKLSNGERLIVALLCDISRKLDGRGEIDPDFVLRALKDHEWSLSWQYHGLLDNDAAPPPAVSETVYILDMWRALEQAYNAFPQVERERVDAALGGPDRVMFGGFDGNHDEHHGIAHHLIRGMGRYLYFKDHAMNSHSQASLPRYRAMLERFDRAAFHDDPSAERIIAAVGARPAD